MQHPQDHGAAAECDEESESDDPDNDELIDEHPNQQTKHKRPRQAPKLSSAQLQEYKKNMQAVKAGTASNFQFHPPSPAMALRFKKSSYTLSGSIIWAPHYLFKHLRIPLQPPCPVHGFVQQVTEHQVARPRYYSGLTLGTSGWLGGTVHKCQLCKSDRAALKAAGDLSYKDKHCFFRSYNPAVTRQYFQSARWRFVAELKPVRILGRRAVTVELAQAASALCSMPGGMNPHSLDSFLREMHGVGGDRLRLVALLHQLQAECSSWS
jgi:hypothetical protein